MMDGSFLQSGLTKAVKESKISLQQAEYEFLSFVRQQTPPGLCPLAGKVCSFLITTVSSLLQLPAGRQRPAAARGEDALVLYADI